MSSNVHKYGLLAIKALLTVAFVAAGSAKLLGAEMMVQTFEAVGVGQWFRYVTGIIEIGGAALLWVRGCCFAPWPVRCCRTFLSSALQPSRLWCSGSWPPQWFSRIAIRFRPDATNPFAAP